MQDPLFTVIMPSFNTAPYIESAILSVCNQTYNNWELLIVIDPGTTDNTYKVAMDTKNSVAQFNKIRIIYSDKPKLQYVTAYGIEEASGTILGILDSDDQLYSESLETSVNVQNRSSKVGFTWSKVRLDSGQRRGGNNSGYEDLFSTFMCSGWWQAQHFKTFKKEWYDKSHGLRLDYPYAVDFNLALCMAESGCDCVYIGKYLYWYRSKRIDSMTNTVKPEQKECYRALKKEWRELHKEEDRAISKVKKTTASKSSTKKQGYKSLKKRGKVVGISSRREPKSKVVVVKKHRVKK